MLRIAVCATTTVAAVTALRMPGPLPWQALPLTGGGILAFVDWRFEPKHQLLLEVPGVCRLYSAAFAPGDATLFHAHWRPTAYVCLAHRRGDTVTNEVAAIEEATVEGGEGGQKGSLQPPVALQVAEGVHFAVAHSKQRPLVHRLTAATTNTARTAFLGVESHLSPPLRSSPPDGRAPPLTAASEADPSVRWQLLEATGAFVVVGVVLLPGEAVRLGDGPLAALETCAGCVVVRRRGGCVVSLDGGTTSAAGDRREVSAAAPWAWCAGALIGAAMVPGYCAMRASSESGFVGTLIYIRGGVSGEIL